LVSMLDMRLRPSHPPGVTLLLAKFVVNGRSTLGCFQSLSSLMQVIWAS
jgi:hypothetical protein